MSRFSIVFAALVGLCALAVAPARAQECMETGSSLSMESRIALATFEWSSTEVDALLLLSSDPGISRFDETAESIDRELEGRAWGWLARDRYEALTALSGSVLWCLTPDDPRCAPVDSPTRAPELAPPFAATVASDAPAPIPPVGLTERPVAHRDSERPGVRHRVERPPRT